MAATATDSQIGLQWTGKDFYPKLEPRVLIHESDKSYHSKTHTDADQFDNWIIQGDNLLAIKTIEQEFSSKVKCVFIDPPYNTGSLFAHYGDKMQHSLWLDMMIHRLPILRTLLSEDGSLWISVDDNEAHYLKVVCDEIFGRSNFLANVIWQRKHTIANDAKFFSPTHDHILVYAKNKKQCRINKIPRADEMNACYANPDGHQKGIWRTSPIYAKSGSEKSRLFKFRFKNGYEWTPPSGTFSRFSEETLRRLDDANEISFGKDGKSGPSRKTFLSELASGTPPSTIWLHDEVGNNRESKNEVKVFNATDIFDTPKPERLMQKIIHLASNPGDLILDSFAGSGTTGAVAHKMGRRWLMVEMGDHAQTHIIPRMKMVIDGTDKGGVTAATNWSGGGGFRFFSLSVEEDWM